MNSNERTRVKRLPKRGHYDAETIYNILDKEFVCHIGFIYDGYPVVIPTLYGRKDAHLYVHGSSASRMLKNLSQGIDVSVAITRVNGLVLARSGFHHSMNYESVVIFGTATEVEAEDEKLNALKCISDHIIAGRWEEVRPTKDNELKATKVLKLPLEEASAKIRTGGPKDDDEDYGLNIWAGVIPCKRTWQLPEADELLNPGISFDPSINEFLRKNDKS